MSLIGDGAAYRQQAQAGLMAAADAEQGRAIANREVRESNNAAKAEIGSAIGGAGGMLIGNAIAPGVGGPVGGALGGLVGGLIGRKL